MAGPSGSAQETHAMERDLFCDICDIDITDSRPYRVNIFQMVCWACKRDHEEKSHGYRDNDYDDWDHKID